MEEQECCVCGIAFCIPEKYAAARRKDRRAFFCPNGDSLVFPAEEPQDNVVDLKIVK